MLSDKKKSLVKFYARLVLIFCVLIVLTYFVDIFLIKPKKLMIEPENLWFEYAKSALFGIFTGLLTGLAITFYEYRQQIYSELYSYIKLNREYMSSIQNVLSLKNYSLCMLQITQYQNTAKSIFVIRKLRKNNEQIVNLINEIKRNVSDVYLELSKLNNEFQSYLRDRGLIESQNEELIILCCTSNPNPERAVSIQALQEQKQTTKEKLRISEEHLETLSNNCKKILEVIEEKNQTLYEYVNNCRHVFIF